MLKLRETPYLFGPQRKWPSKSPRRRRRGALIVLAAFCLALFMALTALALDLGYLLLVRTELQRTADASALAGAGALATPFSSTEIFRYHSPLDLDAARVEARRYVAANGADRFAPGDDGPRLAGDVLLGALLDPSNHAIPMAINASRPNSVQVSIPLRRAHANGPVSLFFARAFGVDHGEVDAAATATVVDYPVLIPIVTSVPHWQSLPFAGQDRFGYRQGQIVNEPDGRPEISIFPGTWDGNGLPPGNFGTVRIGPRSGTTVLRAQIADGPSLADLQFHGGTIYAGDDLVGETGARSGLETAFLGGQADGITYPGIVGKVRFMPLYNYASGNGHNARFTIDRFVAVRIMMVRLRSGAKEVVVQAAPEQNDLFPTVRLTR